MITLVYCIIEKPRKMYACNQLPDRKGNNKTKECIHTHTFQPSLKIFPSHLDERTHKFKRPKLEKEKTHMDSSSHKQDKPNRFETQEIAGSSKKTRSEILMPGV